MGDNPQGKPEKETDRTVNDQEGSQLKASPSSVDRAVKLLWASVVLRVLTSIWMIISLDGLTEDIVEKTSYNSPNLQIVLYGIVSLISALIVILMVFLTYKIHKGRNWARVIMMWLIGIGLFLTFRFFDLKENLENPILGMLNLVSSIIDVLILDLLYKTSDWFKS